MDLIDKYLAESKEKESDVYKNFLRRIDTAKTSNEITKVLNDIKKAVKTDSVSPKEVQKLVDRADDILGDM